MSGALPGRLARRASGTPRATALRRKAPGRWEQHTWADFHARAARTGLGLAADGVGRGDAVVIVADNRPEWLFVDLGAQGLGAVSVPADPGADAGALRRLLDAVDPAVVVVEDAEQFDKLAGSNRPLVVIDPRGIADLDPRVTLAAVEARGAAGRIEDWDAAAQALQAEGLAVAGAGDGLTHGALVAVGERLAAATGVGAGADVLAFLPLYLGPARAASAAALVAGWVVNFGEGPDTFTHDLQELQPDVFLAPAAVWERLANDARGRLGGARGLKRAASRWALGHGPGGLAELLVHRPLRARLGFARIRAALSAFGRPGPDAAAFFTAIGIEVRELADDGGLR